MIADSLDPCEKAVPEWDQSLRSLLNGDCGYV
jgi:hypothetical protein